MSPIWARFLVANLFYSKFRFNKVIRVLLFLAIFSNNVSACGHFSTDNLIIDIFLRVSLCVLGSLFCFLPCKLPLNSLQNNRYSIRLHAYRALGLFVIVFENRVFIVKNF
jgi:hypothetical protein